jgi:hypothetical protein
MHTEFEQEKAVYMKDHKERAETYNSIIGEVQSARGKLRELETRTQMMQRQLIVRAKEIGDLEIDKRGKER